MTTNWGILSKYLDKIFEMKLICLYLQISLFLLSKHPVSLLYPYSENLFCYQEFYESIEVTAGKKTFLRFQGRRRSLFFGRESSSLRASACQSHVSSITGAPVLSGLPPAEPLACTRNL